MDLVLNHIFVRHKCKKKCQPLLKGPSGVHPAHVGGYSMYRNLSFLMMLAAGVLAANCFMQHKKHDSERPEFVPYAHLRLRHKRFPWGEGEKSFFHNKHVNPLPDGYEEEEGK